MAVAGHRLHGRSARTLAGGSDGHDSSISTTSTQLQDDDGEDEEDILAGLDGCELRPITAMPTLPLAEDQPVAGWVNSQLATWPANVETRERLTE